MEFNIKHNNLINSSNVFYLILFISIAAIPFKLFAQGFYLTNEASDIDSLLQTRIDISKQVYDLFDYLTEFKYYDYDEINEFRKAKQIEKKQQIINSFKNRWHSKYYITFNDVISAGESHSSFFYLNPYDFDSKLFKISFGNIPKEIIFDKPEGDKLKIVKDAHLPKNTFLKGVVLRLKLNENQSRSYILTVPTDQAETLKYRLINNPIICRVAVELYPGYKLIFGADEFNYKYFVLELKFKILSFIIIDYYANKILEWRAE